jgi:hypothetical protein
MCGDSVDVSVFREEESAGISEKPGNFFWTKGISRVGRLVIASSQEMHLDKTYHDMLLSVA